MCGIAGLITSPVKPLTKDDLTDRINAMQTALLHRGPNHQDIYFSPQGKAAICHTRLSIIDPNDRANQPMLSEDGRYILSFNGEIYNYRKLRTKLEEGGVEFNSESDTEVVLKLLIEHGVKALSSLRGMFTIAFWDEQHQSLLLARDPLGIKPVYYCARDGSMAFASEVRALLQAGLSSRKLSSRGVNQYLLRGSFSEPDTAFTDIKLLPAGTFFQWQQDRPKLQRYWTPPIKVDRNMKRDHAIELTRTALEHSIKAHLVSDVPLGLFLSGGIDSTVILAIAKQLSSKDIKTYSLAFEDAQWNEGDIAKRTAKHFGTHHTEWKIDSLQAQKLFSEFLASVDQPTIDGFNTYCISKLANDNGEKVVLTGLGADELFAGYPSFQTLPILKRRALRFKWLSLVLSPARNIIDKLISPKGRRLLDLIYNADSIAIMHQSFRGVFSQSEANYLTHQITGKQNKVKHHKLRTKNTLDQISELEMSVYCRNQLLRDSDIFSMAFGVELRVPFIDKVLIEQLSTVPKRWRLDPGKRLLIDSVPELPEWVVDRPKQGFRFPFDEWLRKEWSNMPIASTPSWIKLTPWYRRWSLAVLQDWIQRHVR